jgi:uncharacterized protein YegJ (DUF2314 family)
MIARICLAAAAALSLTAAAAAPAVAQDPDREGFVDYSADNAAMNAAIAEARRTLPAFWTRLSANEPDGGEMLKVALPASNGGREHIWVEAVSVRADGYTGRLYNHPRRLPGMVRGSPVRFQYDQISDWTYVRHDRMWGNYTLRVMLDDLPPEDARRMRASLSDTPLEPAPD